MYSINVKSPVGNLVLYATEKYVTDLYWGVVEKECLSDMLDWFKYEIQNYFTGEKPRFLNRLWDFPVSVRGTEHQKKVYAEMQKIPYGQTRTYGEIAKAIGSSAQAVGTACGKNPIPIIVPCHRVVASDSIGGYSGGKGIETKRFLLEFERQNR